MSESPKIPAVEIALRTDPGRDPEKQVNEDSASYVETRHGLLAVVCDGMGGHAGGKEASELAVKTIVEIVEAAPPAAAAGAALKRAIEEANAKIWSMPTAEVGFRPGSTVVAIIAHPDGIEVAHVGDSRIYLAHAGAVSQVTRDHSMVQEMVDRNLIRAEDAAKHPDANKILRALGIAKEVEVELRHEPLAYTTGDVLVLCSDGLSDLVEPAEILQIAGTHPPLQAAGQLVDLANARGGHDNITALVVRMKTSSTTREAPALMKTMPLTAHEMPADFGVPKEQGSGPTGTMMGPPLTPAGGAPGAPGAPPTPMPLMGSAPNVPLNQVVIAGPHPSGPNPVVNIPSAPAGPVSRTSVSSRPRSPVAVVFGIVLALFAVGIIGAVAYTMIKPNHRKPVPLINNDSLHDGSAGSTTLQETDGSEAPQVVPAPTLVTSAKTLLPRSDGGGFWDPCATLVNARKTTTVTPGQITALEQKCRAAGGNP